MTATDTTAALSASGVSSPRLFVPRLRELARRALRRMYRPTEGVFAFRLRRTPDGVELQGVSQRYTAMALIGLAAEPPEVAQEVLAPHDPADVCARLVEHVAATTDLGAAALALWAARAMEHPAAEAALRHLCELRPDERPYPTVEVAWALAAQAVPGPDVRDPELHPALARRLMVSFHSESGLFPHWPAGARASRLRGHVGCYADLVYPIHALSHHHLSRDCPEALAIARRCAARMCALQGPEGQWWWHYDVRTGRVVERYPVYAVHQDAMAPMALFALAEAGADEERFLRAAYRGLAWLQASPELEGGSLVDEQAGVIWRKVGRREPGRLVRGLQAGASRLHPALRWPGADELFPPGRIDAESRPYHMGWILYAWRGWGGSDQPQT